MKTVYRGIVCKVEILEGKDLLKQARLNARKLYNFAWWCAIGYNQKVRRMRRRAQVGINGKWAKYPGCFGMCDVLKDTEEFLSLNPRIASYVLRGLDSNIRSWFSNLKINPRAKPPKYEKRCPPLVFEVNQNAKHLNKNIWRLTIFRKQATVRHAFIRIYLPPLTCPERVESIKLLANGKWAISYKVNIKSNIETRFAGIDLGINKIAVVAFENGESILYSGGLYLDRQRYYSKKTSKCKPSGYNENKISKKQSKRYYQLWNEWNKQKRLILDNLTSSIVQECKQRNIKSIAIGYPKGITENRDYGSKTNQKLHSWPFYQIIDMVSYKAEKEGIDVIKANEAYTSRTCTICNHINSKSARKERGLLFCENCGTVIHADVNGAFNIMKKYLPPDRQVGVVARLRGESLTGRKQGVDQSLSQIQPTFSAKFDLRNFTVVLNRC